MSNYVSVLKINGNPILPPLMTNAIRQEMKLYKLQAIKLEKRIENINKNKEKKSICDDEESVDRTSTVPEEKSHQEQGKSFNATDNINVTEGTDGGIGDYHTCQSFASKIDSSDSEIVTEDETHHPKSLLSEEVMTIGNTSFTETSFISIGNIDNFKEDESIHSQSSDADEISVQTSAFVDLKNKKVPSTSLNTKLRPKSSIDLTKLINEKPKLVRSNSYTLDNPSPLLIKHMESKGINITSDTATSTSTSTTMTRSSKEKKSKLDLIKSKIKIDTALKTVQKPRPPISNRIGHANKKTISLSNAPTTNRICRKSPYDCKLSTKKKINLHMRSDKIVASSNSSTKGEAVIKNKLVMASKNNQKTPLLGNCNADTLNPQFAQENISNILSKIEQEHKKRMEDLLLWQQEEQRKMHESFNEQQSMLLKTLQKSFPKLNLNNDNLNNHEINGNIVKIVHDERRTSTPLTIRVDDFSDSFLTPNRSPKSTISLRSSREKLESPDPLNQVSIAYLKQYLGAAKKISGSSTAPSTNRADIQMQEKAATRINSHARGYLVRRLLRTNHVQDIIHTLKDTLYYIWDLKRNPKFNDAQEMQLKRGLLQQLNATCSALNEIFFEVSLKERMAIISKDRAILKNKLNLINSNRRSFLGLSIARTETPPDGIKNFDKLKICSLIPINIQGDELSDSSL